MSFILNTFVTKVTNSYINVGIVDRDYNSAILSDGLLLSNKVTKTHQPYIIPTTGKGMVLTTATTLYYDTIYFNPMFFLLGNVSSDLKLNLVVWNAQFKSAVLESLIYDESQGVGIDISNGVTFAPFESKVFQINVDKEGSALINVLAQFTFDNNKYYVLPISGDRTTLISLIPNENFTETLTYKTNISKSKRKELRASLATMPLRAYKQSYQVDEQFLSVVYSMFDNAQSKKYLLPLWQEMQLVESTSIGTRTFVIEEGLRGFVKGSNILLWESETKYELAEIVARKNNTISLKNSIGANYGRAFIIPLVQVDIEESVKINKANQNRLFEIDVTCLQVNGALYANDLDYPTLEGLPVFNKFSETGDNEFKQDVTYIRDTMTEPEKYVNFEKTQIAQTISVTVNNKSDYNKMLDFVHYLKGAFNAFWLPTMTNDIELGADILNNSGVFSSVNKVDLIKTTAVKITQGANVHYALLGDVIFNTTYNVSFKPNITFKVDKTQPYQISFMRRVRSASDSLQITHKNYYTKTLSFTAVEIG